MRTFVPVAFLCLPVDAKLPMWSCKLVTTRRHAPVPPPASPCQSIAASSQMRPSHCTFHTVSESEEKAIFLCGEHNTVFWLCEVVFACLMIVSQNKCKSRVLQRSIKQDFFFFHNYFFFLNITCFFFSVKLSSSFTGHFLFPICTKAVLSSAAR